MFRHFPSVYGGAWNVEGVLSMKARMIFGILLGAFASAVALAATPAVSLPPFVYTGRITDYELTGFEGTTKGAEIRARKDGVLIARAPIAVSSGDTVCNYTLAIPVASSEMPGAAVPGDDLTFEIDPNTGDTNDVYTATNTFMAVGSPGRVARVDVCVATCTNPYGVADQYLDALAAYWREYESGPFVYDPKADWDGDGVSNYDEYLAGTDPLNPDDAGLRILTWKQSAENPDAMEATFLPGRGRVYSAERRDAEPSAEFKTTTHAESPASDAPRKTYLSTGSSDPDIRAIYLFRDGASGMYRLRLE